MKHLIFFIQVVLLVSACIAAGSIIKSVRDFIIATPWLAGSLTVLFTVGFLALLSYLSKRIWN